MRGPSKDAVAAAMVATIATVIWVRQAHVGGFGMPAPYDEGNTVVAAWRVLEGDLLYRDVWQMHPPGTAYLLAAAFKIFGTTLLVERLLKAALLVASAALLYRLARHLAEPALAMAAALLFVLDTAHYPYLRPNDPAFALAIAALLAALRALEAAPRVAVLAGALAGLAATFRHDFGLYAAAAVTLQLASRIDARRLVGFGAGVLLVVVPSVALLRLAGLLDLAIAQTLTFPATTYAQSRHVPIFDVAAFGAPLLLLASGLVSGWRRRRDPLRLVAVAGLAFYGYAGLRPDGEHLLPVRAMAAIAAAGLLERWGKRMFARGIAAVALAGLLLPALVFKVSRGRVVASASSDAAVPAVARGLANFPVNLREAAQFLDAYSAPDARVFVGNQRHDRISLNATLLYFIAQRRGATRYYNLHPGLATTRAVQREIIDSLDQIPAIVLWDAPLWNEPNASGRSSGVHDLDTAIRERYREVARWGPFSGWERLR